MEDSSLRGVPVTPNGHAVGPVSMRNMFIERAVVQWLNHCIYNATILCIMQKITGSLVSLNLQPIGIKVRCHAQAGLYKWNMLQKEEHQTESSA